MKYYATLVFLFCITHFLCFPLPEINSLKDAIQIAEQNSIANSLQKQLILLNMKTASLNISSFMPEFEFAIAESVSSQKNSTDSRSNNIMFAITQPIFSGGKNKLLYDMAKSQASIQYIEYEASLQKFHSSITRQYYEYAHQHALTEIHRNLTKNAEKQEQIIKKEYELGLRTEYELLEHLVSTMAIKDELKKQERLTLQMQRAFKISLGFLPDEEVVINHSINLENINTIYLEPYSSLIWKIINQENINLKTERMNFKWSKTQAQYNRRIYLPDISLTGSISFSGKKYPLTEPSYSFRINVSFSNNPFLPISLSNGYGFNKKRLSSASSSAQVSGKIPMTYFTTQKQENIQLQGKMQNIKDSEISMQENVFSLIAQHDECIDTIKRIESTIKIREKKLEISLLAVEKGERKRIDYLSELEEYANEKINLSKAMQNLLINKHELELLANIPLGELENVLFKN